MCKEKKEKQKQHISCGILLSVSACNCGYYRNNKNNKIWGVLPGQNSFLIFIGVYRQHYYEENKIIKIRNYL
ncbi:hypothetical protein FD456_19995 [Escherichia coli]|nr:hypothetical protein [Escherichia coli]